MSRSAKSVVSPVRPYRAGWLVVSVIVLLATPTATGARSLPGPPAGGACQVPAVTDGGVLSARFWETDADTITASFGESAVIAGSLTAADGAPLPDATLCVQERLIGAGAEVGDRVAVPRIGLARTDADGTYVYRMPPGPNREAIVVYGDRAAYALRYFAETRPTLNAAPTRAQNKGRPVRFWGRLPGPQAGGRVVVLQAAAGPRRWLAFRQATTDREGRFRARYRFTRTLVPTVYSFRALVPRQSGYPWLPGGSQWVEVLVS
jgi:hypothetical protein